MEDPESLDLDPGMFQAGEPATLTALVGRRLPNGLSVPVSLEYAVVDGKAVHQGDIVLGDAETVAATERKRRDGRFALIVTNTGDTWPGGIVPIGSDRRSAPLLAATVAYFHQATPFRLVPDDGHVDRVYVQAGGASESRIGRAGGLQLISVAPGATVGTLAHEICHALGLWHEQCRPDRDRYVTVNQANIVAGYESQFAIQQVNAAAEGPYDYASLMHYPGNAYAKPGTRTITRKDGGELPARNGLSHGDLAGLRKLYPALFP